MKTSLWSREEAHRARPLVAGLEQDIAETLGRMDRLIWIVRERQAAFDLAPPEDGASRWIDLVQAQERLDAALEALGRVADETAALNGRIDYAQRGRVRLAGCDDDGHLVEWVADDDATRAEPVGAFVVIPASAAA